MTITQALDAVSAKYVPGTVAYYAKLIPDPWQSAHDELEKLAGRFDDDYVSAALARFVERCTELTERFKRDATPSQSVSPVDAFSMSDGARVQAHMSRKFKRCVRCDSQVGLRIVPVSPGSMDVMLLCADHPAPEKERG